MVERREEEGERTFFGKGECSRPFRGGWGKLGGERQFVRHEQAHAVRYADAMLLLSLLTPQPHTYSTHRGNIRSSTEDL